MELTLHAVLDPINSITSQKPINENLIVALSKQREYVTKEFLTSEHTIHNTTLSFAKTETEMQEAYKYP